MDTLLGTVLLSVSYSFVSTGNQFLHYTWNYFFCLFGECVARACVQCECDQWVWLICACSYDSYELCVLCVV